MGHGKTSAAFIHEFKQKGPKACHNKIMSPSGAEKKKKCTLSLSSNPLCTIVVIFGVGNSCFPYIISTRSKAYLHRNKKKVYSAIIGRYNKRILIYKGKSKRNGKSRDVTNEKYMRLLFDSYLSCVKVICISKSNKGKKKDRRGHEKHLKRPPRWRGRERRQLN